MIFNIGHDDGGGNYYRYVEIIKRVDPAQVSLGNTSNPVRALNHSIQPFSLPNLAVLQLCILAQLMNTEFINGKQLTVVEWRINQDPWAVYRFPGVVCGAYFSSCPLSLVRVAAEVPSPVRMR